MESYLTVLNEAGEESFKMYKKYGSVALLTVTPSVIYNYIFRQSHKMCTKGCKSFKADKACWYTCYFRAITLVIAAIRRDLGQVNSVPDRNQREALKNRLEAEDTRWQEKYETLKRKLELAREKEREEIK